MTLLMRSGQCRSRASQEATRISDVDKTCGNDKTLSEKQAVPRVELLSVQQLHTREHWAIRGLCACIDEWQLGCIGQVLLLYWTRRLLGLDQYP